MNAHAEEKPWAKFDSSNGTLTFQYGEKTTLGTDEYLVKGGGGNPGWISKSSSIKTVVFDNTFTQARPTSCESWFSGCQNLLAIKGIENLNTSNVTSMQFMFFNCSGLTSLDLSNFNTSNVTNMWFMFYGCSGLTSLDLSNFDTSGVTSMARMFYGCSDLTSLDLTNFNTSKVTDMQWMFRGCSNLERIYASDKFVTTSLKEGEGALMFEGCTKLAGEISIIDANKTDETYATVDGGYFLDKQYIRPWVKFADGTLTFKYGYKKTLGDNEFGMNADYKLVWYDVRKDIMKVVFDKSFAVARPTTCVSWFVDCSKLTTIEGIENLNTSNVTNMASMFSGCSQLTTLDLSTFDTQNVNNMFNMFGACSNLTTIYASDKFVLTNSWGTNVFSGCAKLMGDIAYDVTKTDFSYAKVDGGYFTDKVYTRPWVKYTNGTLSFKYGYKTTIGENEYLMNEGDNAPQWYTDHIASDGTNSEINKVVIDKMFSAARPTSCYKWFYGLNHLDKIESIENLNTSEVTNMSGMFGLCESLTSLELSHFDTQKVADMSYMFSGAEKLQTIYVSDQFVLQNGINSQQMFNGCKSLKGDISYDESYVDKTYAKSTNGYFIDILNLPRPWVKYADGTLTFQYSVHKVLGEEEYLLNEGANVPEWYNKHANSSEKETDITRVVFDKSFAQARPTSCFAWFGDLIKLRTIESIENLNTSEVTNMLSMFWKCSSLTSLDLSHFDTGKVENMIQLFYGCSSLTNLDLSSFKTPNVTGMRAMFKKCSSLKFLNLSNFDTSKVTDMDGLFGECYSLTSLNLSNFNTSNVIDMFEMFSGCSSLTSLDLSSFNTSKVTDMYSTFYYCSNLKAVYIGEHFSTEQVTGFSNIFDYAPNVTIYSLPNQYESAKEDKVLKERTVKPYVRINPKSEYGTLCVPLGSSLTESSYTGFDKLYQIKDADKDKGTITMEETTSIEPGVPYVYHRHLEGVDFESNTEKSSSDTSSQTKAPVMNVITFDVDENASAAVPAPKNEGSLLKGTFESMVAKGGSYILQTDGNFHPVAADNKTLMVGAYRAYLDLASLGEGGAEIGAKAYRMVFEDGEATGIDRINGDNANKGIYDQADQQPKVFFDLMGHKVNVPQKGEIYIVNGKKVVYNKQK